MLPRWEVFDLENSILDIKKQVYARIRGCFHGGKPQEVDDKYINDKIIVMIKENVPFQNVKGRGEVKPKCEFCGRVHNIKDDYCYPCTSQIKDGNKWEACQELKLKDLYAQIKY